MWLTVGLGATQKFFEWVDEWVESGLDIIFFQKFEEDLLSRDLELSISPLPSSPITNISEEP